MGTEHWNCIEHDIRTADHNAFVDHLLDVHYRYDEQPEQAGGRIQALGQAIVQKQQQERRKAMLVKDRPYNAYEGNNWEEPERAKAQQQASDVFVLQRAKEILSELWKASRVDMYVRSEGDVALSAALYAVENPGVTKVSKRMGALAANEQWAREQEAKGREF